MPKPGLRKTYKYSDEFKATAVQLSKLQDVLIQDVAEALDIHPFMLSRWRKECREGKILTKKVKVDPETAAELKRLCKIERAYAILQEEHTLLKKAIRFTPERRQKSSSTSSNTGGSTT